MRDTNYATELATVEAQFSEGRGTSRIERLRFSFKGVPVAGEEGYRFSWWKDGRLMRSALDGTEDEILEILEKAITNNVFTGRFLERLRLMVNSGC